ncbi:MAG: hypothetical protein JNJ60_15725, partial [Rhodocyclaceae bacterium]|nr:hypothetical protein [Rhodocyclaceae bacterium]
MCGNNPAGSVGFIENWGAKTGVGENWGQSEVISLNPLIASSTSLSAAPNPVYARQSTVLSARVAGSNPGGSVT